VGEPPINFGGLTAKLADRLDALPVNTAPLGSAALDVPRRVRTGVELHAAVVNAGLAKKAPPRSTSPEHSGLSALAGLLKQLPARLD
jgi:hypothetical protein